MEIEPPAKSFTPCEIIYTLEGGNTQTVLAVTGRCQILPQYFLHQFPCSVGKITSLKVLITIMSKEDCAGHFSAPTFNSPALLPEMFLESFSRC